MHHQCRRFSPGMATRFLATAHMLCLRESPVLRILDCPLATFALRKLSSFTLRKHGRTTHSAAANYLSLLLRNDVCTSRAMRKHVRRVLGTYIRRQRGIPPCQLGAIRAVLTSAEGGLVSAHDCVLPSMVVAVAQNKDAVR